MKNLLFLLSFLFTFLITNAQSYRFLYEYTFVPDSTNQSQVSKELMQLDVFKDHSEFLGDLLAKRDSSMFNVKQKTSNSIGSDLPMGNLFMKIYKGKETYSFENIGIERYKISYPTSLKWNLTNETQMIGNYTCQKATLEFGKRHWIAWFTSEIPYQDGPYIFAKLPGLIVSVEDSRKQHSFVLVGNFRVEKSASNISFTNRVPQIPATHEQFNKKWNSFRKNPVGFREQFVINNPQISNMRYFDANGKQQDPAQLYAEDLLKIKKELQTQNNYIDLILYQ